MTDRRVLLEADLRELGADLDVLVADRDVSSAVVARLAGRRHRTRARRLLVAAIVGVLVAGAVPEARAAVKSIIRIGSERIHLDAPPPERRAAARANLVGL